MVVLAPLLIILMVSCKEAKKKATSVQLIADVNLQDSIFRNILKTIDYKIKDNILDDSLSFLILPVHASCPFCRKKTIDSIGMHAGDLPERHFIIISADGGSKLISSFFREQNIDLSVLQDKLFLDSTNKGFQYNLYDEKPTIYYTYKRKAYKKVESIPATIKEDLHYFFAHTAMVK